MIRPFALSQVNSITGFWGRYLDEFSEKGILSQWDQIISTGRLENFYRVARKETGTHEGLRFNDSDVYKWLEGAAYIQKLRPNPKVAEVIDTAIKAIEGAQAEDGYLFTLVQLNLPTYKWRNLVNMHEMYCLGHLFEAAVALHQNLGDTRLLEVSKRAVAHIKSLYGPDKKKGFCGHPEVEIALYRLTEATGDLQYAELADWMIDIRGQRPSPFEPEVEDPETKEYFRHANALILKNGHYDGAYAQDDKPIREQTKIVGHSVRAAYLYAAAAMSAARRNDQDLFDALQTIWENLTTKRMYITGGIGSTGDNEGFTDDFDLPNLNAYAETCAGIALAMWGRRMFEANGNSEYLDIVERVTMNGVLSGVSLDTTLYYYDNPLESRKSHERAPWFTCACCPPNVARFVGSIVQYALWESDDTVYLGMPVDGEYALSCGLTLEIQSQYPHNGKVSLTLSGKAKRAVKLAVRIPDWSDEVNVDFPDSTEGAEYEDGFMVFSHDWHNTSIELDFEMTVRMNQSHPLVMDNVGRLAVSYGPSIYCAEEVKLENAPQFKVFDLGEEIRQPGNKALDGSPVLQATSLSDSLDEDQPLYDEFADTDASVGTVNLIPYRTWNAKGPSYMQVWLRHN
ncbi:MAG: glycoside hydrolase family 127 protein [Armatimonadetes bacterium]|nr:glycoside hydrolase family 127 protein [Armatimonadota bacterium]